MSDDLERYTFHAVGMVRTKDGGWVKLEKAADRIAALEAEVARLRAALEGE